MNIEDQVKQIVATTLNIESSEISNTSHIADELGADSLDAAEIIFEIEEVFEIDLDKADYSEMRTVQDLVDMVSKKL